MVWIWLIVIIACMIIDYLSSDFLFISFSIGAFAAIIINNLNLPTIIQFLIFGIVSILFLLLVYPKIKRKIKVDKLGTKTMEEEYIGKSLILSKEVNDTALIKYQGIFWTFKSINGKLDKGEKVRIIGIEGNKILIEKFK